MYKSHAAEFKLVIVKSAETIGNHTASQECDIIEKCIRKWQKIKKNWLICRNPSMPIVAELHSFGTWRKLKILNNNSTNLWYLHIYSEDLSKSLKLLHKWNYKFF